MKLFEARIALFTACALALTVPLAAVDLAVPGRTPVDAMAIVSVPDAKGMWQGLSRSPLWTAGGEMLFEKLVGGTGNAVVFRREMPKIEEAIGMPLSPDRLFSEEGVRGFDVYMLPPVNQGGVTMTPTVAVIAFHNGDVPARILDHLRNEARGSEGEGFTSPESVVTRTVADGVEVWSFGPMGLHGAALPSVLVLGTTQASVYSALDGRGGAQSVQTQTFRRSFAPLDALPHQMWIYGDGESILKTLTDSTGLPATDVGAFAARDFSIIGNFTADHAKFTQFTPSEILTKEERAMLSFSDPSSTGFSTRRFLPGNPLFAAEMNNFDGPGILDMALEALEAQEATAPQATSIRAGLSTLSQSGGFSVREDVLGAFGKQISFAVTEIGVVPGAMPPVTGDVLLVGQLSRPDDMRNTMKKVEGLIGSQFAGLAASMGDQSGQMVMATADYFRDETHGGETMRLLDVSQAGMFGDMMKSAGITPGYTITGEGVFLLSLKSQTMGAAIDAASGTGKGLAANEVITRADRLLSPARNSSTFLSLSAIGDLLLRAESMLPPDASLNAEVRKVLPVLSGMLKAAGAMVQADTYSANGLTREFLIVM